MQNTKDTSVLHYSVPDLIITTLVVFCWFMFDGLGNIIPDNIFPDYHISKSNKWHTLNHKHSRRYPV